MADLRIFSYLPNPRVWKATIAARFCGVEIEVRGASGKELRNWLWDYDARPLNEDEQRALSSLARTGRVGMTGAQADADYPLTMAHFARLAEHPNSKLGIEPYLRKLSAAA